MAFDDMNVRRIHRCHSNAPIQSEVLSEGWLSRTRGKENTHDDGLETSRRPLVPPIRLPRRRLVALDARPASTTQQLTYLYDLGKVGGG